MITDCFVPTVNFQRFEALCNELLNSSVGIEMAAVTGPAGRGKTTSAERVVVQNPATIYVLYEQEMGASIPALYRAIAFRLTGQRLHTTSACSQAIKEELAYSRRLIMVDEAESMGARQLNALRNLHDTCRVPVLLIGEKSLKAKLARENRLLSRTRSLLEFAPVSQMDLVVFYKSALGLTLPAELAVKLLRHSGGDFRPAIKDALAVERLLKANSLSEITAKVVDEVCKS